MKQQKDNSSGLFTLVFKLKKDLNLDEQQIALINEKILSSETEDYTFTQSLIALVNDDKIQLNPEQWQVINEKIFSNDSPISRKPEEVEFEFLKKAHQQYIKRLKSELRENPENTENLDKIQNANSILAQAYLDRITNLFYPRRGEQIIKLFDEVLDDEELAKEFTKKKSVHGTSAIHMAAISLVNYDLVSKLLKHGANIDQIEPIDQSMIFRLIIGSMRDENAEDTIKIIHKLVEEGANVNEKNANGDSLLYYANHYDGTSGKKITKELIKLGADPRVKIGKKSYNRGFGELPRSFQSQGAVIKFFKSAIDDGDIELVKKLASFYPELKTKTLGSLSEYDYRARWDEIGIKKLCFKIAEKIQSFFSSETLLEYAQKNNKTDVAQAMLDVGFKESKTWYNYIFPGNAEQRPVIKEVEVVKQEKTVSNNGAEVVHISPPSSVIASAKQHGQKGVSPIIQK